RGQMIAAPGHRRLRRNRLIKAAADADMDRHFTVLDGLCRYVVEIAETDPLRARAIVKGIFSGKVETFLFRESLHHSTFVLHKLGERPVNHSTFTTAPRITWPHFSVSSITNLSSSAGEAMNGVLARSAIRAAILESASALLISLLSFAMTSTGVPLGAPMPIQALAS